MSNTGDARTSAQTPPMLEATFSEGQIAHRFNPLLHTTDPAVERVVDRNGSVAMASLANFRRLVDLFRFPQLPLLASAAQQCWASRRNVRAATPESDGRKGFDSRALAAVFVPDLIRYRAGAPSRSAPHVSSVKFLPLPAVTATLPFPIQ